jgi:hypothetical protein
MSAKLLHPGKLTLFAILSMMDLFLTYRLLRQSGGSIYESNPVANAWLNSFGWAGLTFFKVVCVSVFFVLLGLIAAYRPRAAQRLLSFCCLAVAGVVIYSCSLLGTFGRATAADASPAKSTLVAWSAQTAASHVPDALASYRANLQARLAFKDLYRFDPRDGATNGQTSARDRYARMILALRRGPLQRQFQGVKSSNAWLPSISVQSMKPMPEPSGPTSTSTSSQAETSANPSGDSMGAQ